MLSLTNLSKSDWLRREQISSQPFSCFKNSNYTLDQVFKIFQRKFDDVNSVIINLRTCNS